MNLQYGNNSYDVTNKLPTINVHNGKQVVYLGDNINKNGMPPFKTGKYKPDPNKHRKRDKQQTDLSKQILDFFVRF